ncbi:hypothetical protein PMIN06_011147 [Paraphaeosphaeria minitans]
MILGPHAHPALTALRLAILPAATLLHTATALFTAVPGSVRCLLLTTRRLPHTGSNVACPPCAAFWPLQRLSLSSLFPETFYQNFQHVPFGPPDHPAAFRRWLWWDPVGLSTFPRTLSPITSKQISPAPFQS